MRWSPRLYGNRQIDPGAPERGGLTLAGAAGLLGAGANGLAQFVMVVVTTRGFSPAEAGKYFTAVAITLTVAEILKLDAGPGVVHFLAIRSTGVPRQSGAPSGEALGADVLTPADSVPGNQVGTACRATYPAPHLQAAHLQAALLPPLVLSCCVTVPLTLAVVHAAPHFTIFALVLPFVVCADILVAATRGWGTTGATVLLEGLALPFGQVALASMAAANGQAAWLPAAWAVPYVVVALAGVVLVRRKSGFVGVRRELRRQAMREMWRHTGPRAVANAAQAIFQRVDITIVAALAGPVEAAIYTAATRFKVVGQLAGRGLAQAAQPRLARALAGGDLPEARAIYQRCTRWLVLLTWPIWLGYAAFAPHMLRLFGPDYTMGTSVAYVLAITMMLATACGMADIVLISAGHTTSSMVNLLLALATTVMLDLLLVPTHHALGAALGWAGGMLVKNVLPLLHIRRLYGIRPGRD
ncbi:lipopolysaccharide biosynthesis protein [Sinosporangium siamense]|nr:lipopolysaccharide biosynthesis protein [Sinosporangium siamense]